MEIKLKERGEGWLLDKNKECKTNHSPTYHGPAISLEYCIYVHWLLVYLEILPVSELNNKNSLIHSSFSTKIMFCF